MSKLRDSKLDFLDKRIDVSQTVFDNYTTAERNNILRKTSGMVIYNSDESDFQGYDGNDWKSFSNDDMHDAVVDGGKYSNVEQAIDDGKRNILVTTSCTEGKTIDLHETVNITLMPKIVWTFGDGTRFNYQSVVNSIVKVIVKMHDTSIIYDDCNNSLFLNTNDNCHFVIEGGTYNIRVMGRQIDHVVELKNLLIRSSNNPDMYLYLINSRSRVTNCQLYGSASQVTTLLHVKSGTIDELLITGEFVENSYPLLLGDQTVATNIVYDLYRYKVKLSLGEHVKLSHIYEQGTKAVHIEFKQPNSQVLYAFVDSISMSTDVFTNYCSIINSVCNTCTLRGAYVRLMGCNINVALSVLLGTTNGFIIGCYADEVNVSQGSNMATAANNFAL